ncbi:major facilitator family transporter [Myxococcus stipitatus DSM 14675]|uniref:Major facilitator family transporter n=1 Tax=Myxococcus stipitatus (strain DSM 14675 / JCM 12634 / Mx s8) TaxID=1278073 RepID=L7UGG6_MYXSD|nr:MFS transporter [Myxococcus stipitatus]AGC47133.1 major facilitator family transporter [Myxococcus stipitatus DSM 14675]
MTSLPASVREDPEGKNGLFLLCVGFFVFGLLGTVTGVTLPNLKQEFGVTNESAGVVFVYWSVGVLVGAFIGGKVFYLAQARTLFIATSLASLVCLLLLYREREFLTYKLLIFALSLSGSLFFTAGHATAARVGRDNKVSILSFMDFLFSLGSVSTPLLVNAFTSPGRWLGGGWRLVFLVAAGLLVVAMALATRLSAHAGAPPPERTSERSGAGYLSLLSDPLFLCFMFASLFLHATEWGHGVWFVTYASEVVGLPPAQAREAFSFFLIGMAASRLLGSWLIWNLKSSTLMALLISSATVAAISLLDYRSYHALCILNFMFGLGLGALFPLLLGLSMERAPAQSAMLSGIGLMAGTLGAKSISYVIGLLADQSSLAESYRSVSWTMVALLGVVLSFLSLHLHTQRAARAPEDPSPTSGDEPMDDLEEPTGPLFEFRFGLSGSVLQRVLSEGAPLDALRRLLLDWELRREFSGLFGRRRRLRREEAASFLRLVWEKYPEVRGLYPSPAELLGTVAPVLVRDVAPPSAQPLVDASLLTLPLGSGLSSPTEGLTRDR